MNGKVRFSLYVAIGFCLLACTLAASSKVSRRRSPSLTAEQKAQLISSKSLSTRTAKSTGKSTTNAIIEVTKAIARSHSASEVLTLNLTNLLILIVLKAVIFGIGLFYFGGVSFKGGVSHGDNHGHGGYGRSATDVTKPKPFMTEGEMLLALTFLLGSSTEDYTCMNRVACEHPGSVKSYLKASKLMLNGAKFAQK